MGDTGSPSWTTGTAGFHLAAGPARAVGPRAPPAGGCYVWPVSQAVDRADAPLALLRTPGFFRVSQLVPDDQDMMTVMVGTTAGSALDLMEERGFDLLPVTTAGGRVVGAFTYRSFARGARFIRRQDDPLSAPVDDLIEELQFARPSQDVSDVLGFLRGRRRRADRRRGPAAGDSDLR